MLYHDNAIKQTIYVNGNKIELEQNNPVIKINEKHEPGSVILGLIVIAFAFYGFCSVTINALQFLMGFAP